METNEQADAGRGRPNPSRETKFSGANADREMLTFPVQLTTFRIGNLTRVDPYSCYMCDHTCDHTYLSQMSDCQEPLRNSAITIIHGNPERGGLSGAVGRDLLSGAGGGRSGLA